MSDGRTHWEGCWRDHHDCAVAEVERLLGLLGRTRVCVQAELGEYKIFLKRPGIAPDAYVFGLRRLAECDALLTEVAAVLRAAPPTTAP